jgi:murein DD-endopeptidase MepM/ murein hydrolase activator NlpD
MSALRGPLGIMRFLLAAVWSSALLIAATPNAVDSIAITANARSIQPGELVVLTMTAPEEAADLRLHAFNREIPVYRVDGATWRALVGIDLAVRPGPYSASVEARSGSRQLHGTYLLNVLPRRFPTRTLKVDPALVNPPAAMDERIAREAAEVQRLYRQSSADRLWRGPFTPPVPSTVGSHFGSRSIFNGQARSPHGGADFPSPTGAPVAAPNAGRVVLAKDLYFSGNTVILDHGLGLFSMLAHLSVIGVREGDSVAIGQEIGKVGATGRVTGPHLHWGVMADGARVDPLSVLAVVDHDAPRHIP